MELKTEQKEHKVADLELLVRFSFLSTNGTPMTEKKRSATSWTITGRLLHRVNLFARLAELE